MRRNEGGMLVVWIEFGKVIFKVSRCLGVWNFGEGGWEKVELMDRSKIG